MKEGDKVLMTSRPPIATPMPSNTRTWSIWPGPSRHVAFGSGIHRCAGSNLARMELQVALEEWLHRIPAFTLDHGQEMTWPAAKYGVLACFR